MLPDEIYAGSASSSNFKYAHPLSHMPVDDGSLRARLAYDLMTFMKRSDCPYFFHPDQLSTYNPHESKDEVDILIVDGYYKEAEHMIEQRLEENPDDEKSQFQKAFIQHLKDQYQKLLKREEKILKREPKNVNALINKGFALVNLGKEGEALKTMEQALRVEPDNLLALGNKAYIAKLLYKDALREHTLHHAYNVKAQAREKRLAKEESSLLKDFNALFMAVETPSSLEDFNQMSGASDTIH